MDYNSFRMIQSHDPDGWESEPTEEDYREFEAWVVKTYGQAVYDAYMNGTVHYPHEY